MNSNIQIDKKKVDNPKKVTDLQASIILFIIEIIFFIIYYWIDISWIKQILIFFIVSCLSLISFGITRALIDSSLDENINSNFSTVSLISTFSLLFFYYSSIIGNYLLGLLLLVIGICIVACSVLGWFMEKNKLKSKRTLSSIALLSPFLPLLIGNIFILKTFLFYQILTGILVLCSADLSIEIIGYNNKSYFNTINKYRDLFKMKSIVRIFICSSFIYIFNRNLSYFLNTTDFLRNYLNTIIPVLATIVTILIAFASILFSIPQIDEEKDLFFRQGIKGFSLFYLIILILCLALLALRIDYQIVSTIYEFDINNIILDWNTIQCFIGITLFEIIFISVPMGITYLYAIVRDFISLKY